MPLHRTTTVFSGPLVTVTDVSCREPAGPRGAEEHASGHLLVFTRVGVFVRHSAASRQRETVADPLRVLLFNKDEAYQVSHPAHGGDDCTMFAFSDEAVREVARRFDPAAVDRTDPFHVGEAPLGSDAMARYRAVRAAVSAEAPAGLGVEEEGLALLADVLGAALAAEHASRSAARASTGRERRRLVERTRQVVTAAPGEAWTLPGIAREIGSSPFHLTRVFREQTGMPVHRFLVQLRLALAVERLEQGERDITGLAIGLGFSSHSHFPSTFTRAFGVAPSVMRRRGLPHR